MAAIGECRGPRGCSSGKLSICARISGEALSRTQRLESALTATHSCVRGFAARVPERTSRQLGQPQFHWGNPPPAAAPRTLMRMSEAQKHPPSPGHLQPRAGVWITCGCCLEEDLDAGVPVAPEIVLVGIDFGIHLHFDKLWSFPSHLRLLVSKRPQPWTCLSGKYSTN